MRTDAVKKRPARESETPSKPHSCEISKFCTFAARLSPLRVHKVGLVRRNRARLILRRQDVRVSGFLSAGADGLRTQAQVTVTCSTAVVPFVYMTGKGCWIPVQR